MAKGFKQGAGGGASLNFKVVGNPQPQNPKENTIWLNTDTKITGWIFSALQPSVMDDGYVWFPTSASSNAEFNALKKNVIQVYPSSAKQYIGGAWVYKEAKIYQGGAWIDFVTDVYLWKNGVANEALTGGFSGNGYMLGGKAGKPGGVDPSGDLLYAQSEGTMHGVMGTVDSVDLSGYRTLSAMATSTLVGGYSKIYVCSSKNIDTSVVAMVDIAPNLEVSIDITKLTGKYYIAFGADASQADTVSYVRYFKLGVD